jgi:CubicO group peptidase (beta-lactamase class C family)
MALSGRNPETEKLAEAFRRNRFSYTALAAIWLVMNGCKPPSATPPAEAEEPSEDPGRIAAVVDPIINSELVSAGVPGAAFVFVRDGRIVYQKGYGVSDVATGAKVDAERTIWPIASITKSVTAMAALQLVDQGKTDLDTDINRYLKRLQVPAQGFGPLTLRHLLSHTGGLDELPGRQFDGKTRADMAAFIKDRIKRYRAPGERTAYSTYGIILTGILIEDVTGQPYDDYVKQHIFAPAGMERASFMVTRGDDQGVATPYGIEDGRASAIPHEWYVSLPASSMIASAADMGRLMLVHLNKGSGGGKQILSPALTLAMQTQQATVHPDLPGWSLGLQLDRVNGRNLAEHGGDIGGFSSLMTLLPEENAGFFIVSHGEGSDLRFRVKQVLLDALYPPGTATVIPTPDPRDAAQLKEYAGSYISSFACRTCEDAAEQAFPLSAEADGTLKLWGQRWIPMKRDLFIRDDGKRLLGFARDAQGKVASVSGGSWRVADRL